MISNYGSRSGRRILTSPAVHPSESLSPWSLLESLIDLGNSICSYKSRPLSSNRRNTLETFRNVGNLILIFKEINPSNLPDSALLGLSEVHLALQKIWYLVDDCTQDGCRLWMLMKSERVASQFRTQTRSMAIALDILPLESMEVPEEAKELVELFARQSRKMQFQVHRHDLEAIRDVGSILCGFKNGVVPNRQDLIRVLDYIGVRSWGECDGEIRFLDSEIRLETSTEERGAKEIELLSSLMGFMTYCRCVCFNLADQETNQPSNPQRSHEFFSSINSDDFRCPISLEFMVDPVITTTGHTYDRSSILKWFRAGKPICPKTGKQLTSMELIPNLAVRRLVDRYCTENGIPIPRSGCRKNRDITSTALPGSRAAEGAMKMAANFLEGQLKHGTLGERSKAAYEVRLLAKSSIFNRSCLTEARTIPHLLRLSSPEDAVAQENAIAALLNLSKHSSSRVVIIENGGLRPIVEVLEKGLKVESRQHAAATLFYLASIEEYRKLIGEIPGTIPNLVEMVRTGNNRGKKNALVAIFGLLMDRTNHGRVLLTGSVPLLVELLKSSHREDLCNDSLAVLSSLAERRKGASAILQAGAVQTAIAILRDLTSQTGKEYCVALLLSLCINGGQEAVATLARSSSLMESLYSLLVEGTSRAGKKASSLIRLLQEFHEKSSWGSDHPIFWQEQSVHAS